MALKTKSTCIVAVCLIFNTIGCESKFSESSPTSININGLPLEERIAKKSKIDSRIEEVQQATEKAKRIIETFKLIKTASLTEDVYTPVDFLFDINKQMLEKIPENNNGKLIRHGRITVPLSSLSEKCRIIETTLDSGFVYNEDGNETVERITYSLKSPCSDSTEYHEAILADWVGNTMQIKFISKNLEKIFTDIILNQSPHDSSCKMTRDENKILQAIHCENMQVRLSKSEIALLKNMSFSNSDDIRFETLADIFELEKLKETVHVQVFSNGERKIEVKEPNENVNENEKK